MMVRKRILIIYFLIYFLNVSSYLHAETITFQYDQLNRLKKVTDDSSYLATCSFDAAGNRLTKTISQKPQLETIVPGSTSLKASQIIELRQALNSVRAGRGLGTISWDVPDPEINVTLFYASYITKLRSAVKQTYDELNLDSSQLLWEDDPLAANQTTIKANHIIQLQNAISTLWELQ